MRATGGRGGRHPEPLYDSGVSVLDVSVALGTAIQLTGRVGLRLEIRLERE